MQRSAILGRMHWVTERLRLVAVQSFAASRAWLGQAGVAFWAVFGIGTVVRAAVAVAYRPGLFYFDSWLYLGMAGRGQPVEFAPDRPSGYALLIRAALSLLGGLTSLIVVQHLAGLATGLLVYLLLARLGVRRAVAVVATAIVVLDGYEIALEQHVLPEALFALALMGSICTLVLKRVTQTTVALSGLLLATAILLRTAGLFVIPVWLAFVLSAHGQLRPRLRGLVGLVLPLLVYAGLHAAATGQFALTGSDGWFLYQRVATIGGCNEISVPRSAVVLCREPQLAHIRDPSEYIYGPGSPARLAFGPLAGTSQRVIHANTVLREYAIAVIEQRPLRYAELVGSDFLRFFEPGMGSSGRENLTLELPPAGLLLYWDDPPLRMSLFPNYRPVVHFPARLVREYVQAVHTPGWLLGILLVLVGIRLGSILVGRRRVSRRRARVICLLAGTALAILLGSVATTLFRVRYLIPTVPLIVSAGALAISPVPRAAHAGENGDTTIS